MDRVRNEEVCRRVVIVRELTIRAYQRALRWFGNLERMMSTVCLEGVDAGSKGGYGVD